MSKAIVSSLYDSDVFKMACRQFDKAADAISLPEAIRDRTKYPRRCLVVSLPVRRADGSVTVDPNELTEIELEHLSRRYMQEMVNFVGPHVDVPAPDVGTNEKIMGWMMDTYSNHVGHVEPAVVTGKPIALGGSQGRREATGAGVAYLIRQYLQDMKVPITKASIAI